VSAPKFLFDECIGKPGLDVLRELLALGDDEAELVHLLDLESEGSLDDNWVPRLGSEGWIVISADRGQTPSRGGKLPRLCKTHLVTHVLLSGALHSKDTRTKIVGIAHVWTRLLEVADAPRGSEFRLQLTSAGSTRLIGPTWTPPSQ
jgi:hypothetical protein